MIPNRLSIILPAQAIATSITDATWRNPLIVTYGNTLNPFEVELLNPTGIPATPFEAVALPSGFTGIKVLAKAKPSDTGFLFETHDFSGPGDGDPLYTGTLSLLTDPLTAKFPNTNAVLQWIHVHLDVLLTRDDETFETVVTNWPCTVMRGNTTGDEGTPTPLPTPEDWLDARAVRFDKVQTLSDDQKARARQNIGLPTPFADGTYRIGLGVTSDGFITITNGIITSITQASS